MFYLVFGMGLLVEDPFKNKENKVKSTEARLPIIMEDTEAHEDATEAVPQPLSLVMLVGSNLGKGRLL